MESGGHTPLSFSMPASRNGTPSVNGAANGTATALRQTKICVYCGSAPGNSPRHMEAARELARVMAANNIALGE